MKRILISIFYPPLKGLAVFLMWFFFRLKVEGRENLPANAPFIIAANHASFIDPVAIQALCRFRINWITKKVIYENRYLKLFHYIADSIVINGAVNKALEALDKGRVIGVFPEGEMSCDGRVKEGDLGVAILAIKSGCRIVPVRISGSFEAFPRGKKFFRMYPVKVRIGKPLIFEKDERENIEEHLLTETRDKVMDGIRGLLG